MSFRFRRRLRLFSGAHINLSKSGASLTLGVRGLHVTLGKQPAISAGLPGSGLYVREPLGSAAPSAPAAVPAPRAHISWLWLALLAIALVVLLAR